MTQRTTKLQNYLLDKSFTLKFLTKESYFKLKNEILPLDIIAFDNKNLVLDINELYRDFDIQTFIFSHYGLVVDDTILKSLIIDGSEIILKNGRKYVLHFSFDIISISDDMEIKYRDKVTLTSLEEIVFNHSVFWCKLINRQIRSIDLNFLFEEKITDPIYFYANLIPNLPFNERLLEIVFTLIENFKFSLVPNQRSLQIIGKIYQDLGILPLSLNLKDILPIDIFGSAEDFIPAIVKPAIYLTLA